jgi:hypothetical protein
VGAVRRDGSHRWLVNTGECSSKKSENGGQRECELQTHATPLIMRILPGWKRCPGKRKNAEFDMH